MIYKFMGKLYREKYRYTEGGKIVVVLSEVIPPASPASESLPIAVQEDWLERVGDEHRSDVQQRD